MGQTEILSLLKELRFKSSRYYTQKQLKVMLNERGVHCNDNIPKHFKQLVKYGFIKRAVSYDLIPKYRYIIKE